MSSKRVSLVSGTPGTPGFSEGVPEMPTSDLKSEQGSWTPYLIIGGILIFIVIILIVMQDDCGMYKPIFILGSNSELTIKDVAPSNPPTGFKFFCSHRWDLISIRDHSTLTQSNNKATTGADPDVLVSDTCFPNNTGKFYYSVTMTYKNANGPKSNAVGVCTNKYVYSNTNSYLGYDDKSYGIYENGTFWFNNPGNTTPTSTGGSTFQSSSAQQIDVAVDLTAKKVWYRVDGGNWNGNSTNNPSTGVGGWSTSGM